LDLRYTLLGLFIGFLIGLTGMGGGSLMTPVMILLMGVKPVVAVGTDLAYGAITRIVGGGAHLRRGTVNRKTAYLLAAGSVPASVLGVGFIGYIKHAHPTFINGFLDESIAWMLILVAAILVLKPALAALMQRRRGDSANWRDRLEERGSRDLWVLPALGAVVGFLVGLTSVGAGSLIVVSLLFLYPRWQSKDVVGTDVFHAAILVTASGIAQFAAGNVNVPIMLSLLAGSIPGVLLGSRLAVGFPERALRLSLPASFLPLAPRYSESRRAIHREASMLLRPERLELSNTRSACDGGESPCIPAAVPCSRA
jgi:uncharacterized membrane protein YfcA